MSVMRKAGRPVWDVDTDPARLKDRVREMRERRLRARCHPLPRQHVPFDWKAWTTEFWRSTVGAAVAEDHERRVTRVLMMEPCRPMIHQLQACFFCGGEVEMEKEGCRVFAQSPFQLLQMVEEGCVPKGTDIFGFLFTANVYVKAQLLHLFSRDAVERGAGEWDPVDFVRPQQPLVVVDGVVRACPVRIASRSRITHTCLAILRPLAEHEPAPDEEEDADELTPLAHATVDLLLHRAELTEAQKQGIMFFMAASEGPPDTKRKHIDDAGRLLRLPGD